MTVRPPYVALDDDVGCVVCGREACEDHALDASVTTPRAQRSHLTIQRAVDVIAAPPPVGIVEGIAYAGCLTVLVACTNEL
jgi:hypothetical protein